MKPLLRKLKQKILPPKAVEGRTWRPQWLPREIPLDLESRQHPHDPRERSELFLTYSGGSTEMEVLNWLYATILLLKPKQVLETGAYEGFGTVALASACQANGMGMVHSVELDAAACGRAENLLRISKLESWATMHQASSLDYLRTTKETFEFGFFDTCCEIRNEEFKICMDRGILRGPAVFHDTSPYRTQSLENVSAEEHEKFRAGLREQAIKYKSSGVFESRLSRGLIVIYPPA